MGFGAVEFATGAPVTPEGLESEVPSTAKGVLDGQLARFTPVASGAGAGAGVLGLSLKGEASVESAVGAADWGPEAIALAGRGGGTERVGTTLALGGVGAGSVDAVGGLTAGATGGGPAGTEIEGGEVGAGSTLSFGLSRTAGAA